MAKADLGIKRLCQGCGVRFYDLGKSPAVCPKCGTEFDPLAGVKSRRSRPTPPVEEAPKKKPVPEKTADDSEDDLEIEDDDLEIEDDDLDSEDEDMIEDASELGEDDEDVPGVGVEDDEER